MGASKIDKKTLRRLVMDFYLDRETLYKKSSNRTLLRCLDGVEAKQMVKKFMERDLICRYGPLGKIITNNAQNFNSKMIIELDTKWKIKHSNSSPYRPKMNGAAEAANKNVKKII
jgi:radical SAM superfamily enzyme with C-terminal helix-hairpin-helix motif